MEVTRVLETPRVTKPYSEEQWAEIEELGVVLMKNWSRRVRLTMGGEPTFVSIDDMDGAEWNTAAVVPRSACFRGSWSGDCRRNSLLELAALRAGQMVSW